MNKTKEPKTKEEAINSLQEFLEVDLPSKFDIFREDHFTSESEFVEYLKQHFEILKEEIRRLNK